MLPGACPGCGLRADLDVFAAQAGVNQGLAAALDLPAELSGRILGYLRLHSPAGKTMALNKSVRLLVELRDLVRSACVTRRGITHVAPQALWSAGLDAVLTNPPEVLPLSGHSYLEQTVWNLAERQAQRRERDAESQLRHARPSPPCEAALPAATVPPPPAPKSAPISPPAAFSALVKQLRGQFSPPDGASSSPSNPPQESRDV